MKRQFKHSSILKAVAAERRLPSLAAGLLLSGVSGVTLHAQSLTHVDINNPVTGVIAQNGGNITITAGGGDTYGTSDSFTYLYEQRTGNFDVKVQVLNVDADDPVGAQNSAKAALHVRASLDKSSPDIQVNATPVTGAGYIETISRPVFGGETEDPPENTAEFRLYNGAPWPGTYKTGAAMTYPVWLRVRREGNLFQTMASVDAVTWSVLAEYSMEAASFPSTVYVGLAGVAHVSGAENPGLRVRASFAGYGDVPASPPPNQGASTPGPFPNTTVTGVNWNVSLPANGIGFSADKTQSGQIIWNGGGFDTIHRDIILDIGAQGPVSFSAARYAAGAIDFGISPADPVAARANLGSGATRDRDTPTAAEAPSRSWFPSPRHGVLIPVLRKNGTVQWNDGAGSFYPHVYQAVDFSSAKYFNMDSGVFTNGQTYTRMAKRGSVAPPQATAGVYQRSAVDVSVAWFPYSQGWKAGYFEDAAANAGKAHWQNPASHSAAATENTFVLTSNPRSTAEALLSWIGPNNTGLAELGFPSVNAAADGMLFLAPNNDGSASSGAATMRGPQANCTVKADGSAWTVAIRDVEANKFDATAYADGTMTEFSFLYVPYNSGGLIGGQITGSTGTASHSAGTYSLERSAAGRYQLTIPGKTAASGMIILQPVGTLPGNPAVVDRVTMGYEPAPDGNSFIIESRGISPGTASGGMDEFPLQDSDFYFAWVDFTAPLTPPGAGAAPPLTIVRGDGDTMTISWPAGVSGYILESSSTLSAPWTLVNGVSNNSVTITADPATPRLFFRLNRQ